MKEDLQSMTLTLAEARRAIAGAERKATEMGLSYNVAIVDAGGNLVAHVRMDGAWLGSIDIAINKAFTARAFDMSTSDLGKAAQPGEPLFGIHVTNRSRVVIFGGGVPLKKNGVVVGAIGASGDSVENDISVAEAGALAYGARN